MYILVPPATHAASMLRFKIFILTICFFPFSGRNLYAFDKVATGVLTLLKTDPAKISQKNVITSLGKPAEIDTRGSKIRWGFTRNQYKITVLWEKDGKEFKKLSFEWMADTLKKDIDYGALDKLVTGTTSINDVLKILGIPADMTLKPETQEVHYAYRDKTLRLFFRKKTLADFTLY